jgi:PSP1 C-terminal conserved region
MDPAISQKFGSLPTLSTHIQHQRMPHDQRDSYNELQKPRHVRSISQPVAPTVNQGGAHLPLGMQVDPRYYQGVVHPVSASYGDNGFTSAGHSRGTSTSYPTLANSYDTSQFTSNVKRGSMPNMGGTGYGQAQSGYPPLQRRDALDFHMSPGSQSNGPVVASAEDMRAFIAPSMISPGHSPHQVHYGGHSRQTSDGSNMLTSSPMSSLGGGVGRGPNVHMHRRESSGDDELTHPLIGENIEVPAEHFGDDHGLSGGYMTQSASHPLLRPSSHGHSQSLDQLPPQYADTAHLLPTAGAALPMPKVVFSVKFKRSQRNFVLGPRINRDLKIGTYVKVEADRGEDLGIVIGKAPAEKYNYSSRTAFSAGMGPPPGLGAAGAVDLKRIIRLATHDEVSLLAMKREEEEELLKICRGKVRQRCLPMHVVDAEYQFDRHKLTFFFEAEGRVDFRELVRDLFSMYKTRIWMQQLDKTTATSTASMMVPLSPQLQMDFGTPIIAPASEFADSIAMSGMGSGDARSY